MIDYFQKRTKNHPEAFAFINPRTGTHYTASAFRKVWERVRQKGNLPKSVRCYDATRHSLGSQLANAGESIYKISKILGHSSIKMTEKYLHKDVTSLRSTLSKLSLKKQGIVIDIDENRFQRQK
jgi:site-specific recombinase XerD